MAEGQTTAMKGGTCGSGEEGREGQQVDFTDEDAFGKVAVYQTNRKPSSIGFIVRLNQWEHKDKGDAQICHSGRGDRRNLGDERRGRICHSSARWSRGL